MDDLHALNGRINNLRFLAQTAAQRAGSPIVTLQMFEQLLNIVDEMTRELVGFELRLRALEHGGKREES